MVSYLISIFILSTIHGIKLSFSNNMIDLLIPTFESLRNFAPDSNLEIQSFSRPSKSLFIAYGWAKSIPEDIIQNYEQEHSFKGRILTGYSPSETQYYIKDLSLNIIDKFPQKSTAFYDGRYVVPLKDASKLYLHYFLPDGKFEKFVAYEPFPYTLTHASPLAAGKFAILGVDEVGLLEDSLKVVITDYYGQRLCEQNLQFSEKNVSISSDPFASNQTFLLITGVDQGKVKYKIYNINSEYVCDLSKFMYESLPTSNEVIYGLASAVVNNSAIVFLYSFFNSTSTKWQISFQTMKANENPNQMGPYTVVDNSINEIRSLSVASLDTSEEFVITWINTDDSMIYHSLYRYPGDRIIDSEPVNQVPVLSSLASVKIVGLFGGGYLIAWDNNASIIFQQYFANGSKFESNNYFNSSGVIDFSHAYDVIAVKDGGFVFSWYGDGNDIDGMNTNEKGPFMIRFNSDQSIFYSYKDKMKYDIQKTGSEYVSEEFVSLSTCSFSTTAINFTTIGYKKIGRIGDFMTYYMYSNASFYLTDDRDVTSSSGLISTTDFAVNNLLTYDEEGFIIYGFEVSSGLFGQIIDTDEQLFLKMNFKGEVISTIYKLGDGEAFNFAKGLYSGKLLLGFMYSSTLKARILNSQMVEITTVDLFAFEVSPYVEPLVNGGFAITFFSEKIYYIYTYDDFGNQIATINGSDATINITSVDIMSLSNGGLAFLYITKNGILNLFTFDYQLSSTSTSRSFGIVKSGTLIKTSTGFALIYAKTISHTISFYINQFTNLNVPFYSQAALTDSAWNISSFSFAYYTAQEGFFLYFSSINYGMIYQRDSCNTTYFIQAASRASCTGTSSSPCDSLWKMLLKIGEAENAIVYVLKNTRETHYAILDDTLDGYSKVWKTKTFKNLTIKPLTCTEASASYPSLASNCTGDDEKIRIYLKNMIRVNAISLKIENIIFDGSENIMPLNSDTNQTALKMCMNSKVRCCNSNNLDALGFQSLYCKRKASISDYNAFSLDSIFNVKSELSIKNCEFSNIHSPDFKSLFNLIDGIITATIADTTFDKLFFRVGTIFAKSLNVYFTGSNILFTNYNDWAVTHSYYDAFSLDEGYFFYGYRVNFTLSNSSFDNAGFQIRGCPQRLLNFYSADRDKFSQNKSKSDLKYRYDLLSSETSSLINIKSAMSVGIYSCSFEKIIGKIGSVLSLNFNQWIDGNFEISHNSFTKNFASHAFSTICINKRAYGINSDLLFNNTFQENFGCLESFGNVYVSYELLKGYVNLNISSNNFIKNFQAISNSIAAFNTSSFYLSSNYFYQNGGPSGDFGFQYITSSYFASLYDVNAYITNYSSFAQSTVLYIDTISDLYTNGNRFEQNWGPFEGSSFLGDLVSVKNFEKKTSGIIFNNDIFYNHSSGVDEFEGLENKIFFYGSTWLLSIYASQRESILNDVISFENCTLDLLNLSFSKSDFLKVYTENKNFKAKDKFDVAFLRIGDYSYSQDLDVEKKDDIYSRELELIHKNCTFTNIKTNNKGNLLFGNLNGNMTISGSTFSNLQDIKIISADVMIMLLTFENCKIENHIINSVDLVLMTIKSAEAIFNLLDFRNVSVKNGEFFSLRVLEKSHVYIYNSSFSSCLVQSKENKIILSSLGSFYFESLKFYNSSPLIYCEECNELIMNDINISSPLVSQTSYLGNFTGKNNAYFYNFHFELETQVSVLNFVTGNLDVFYISKSTLIFTYIGSELLFSASIDNMTLNGSILYNKAENKQNKIFDIRSSSYVEIKNNIFYNPYELLTLMNMAGTLIIEGNIFELSDPGTLIFISQTNSAIITISSNIFNSKTIPSSQPSYLISLTDQSQSSQISKNIFNSPTGSKGIIICQCSYNSYDILFEYNVLVNSMGTPLLFSSTNYQNAKFFHMPTAKISFNLFVMNRAVNTQSQNIRGGAISILSTDYSTQSTFINSNSFIKNLAQFCGGAIYFNWNMPKMIENNFTHNFAQKLNHIYSFPVRISFFINGGAVYTPYEPSLDGRILQETTSSEINQFPSGIDTTINYSFALVDMFDQLYFTDSSSYLTINPSGYEINEISKFTSIYSIQASKGVYEFNTLNFKYEIGKELNVYFNSSAIPVQSNPLSSLAPALKLTFSFRNCMSGEYLLSDRTCSSCSSDYWLPTVSNNSEGPCNKCDSDKLLCKGGSNIGPLPGYWLYNASSDNVMTCPYADACLGNSEDSTTLDVQGSCATGHEGNLCANCKQGFGKFGSSGACSDCQNDRIYYLKIVGSILGSLILFIYGIADTLKSIMIGFNDHEEKRGVYMRILMNYLQLISLIGKIDIEWPSSVSTLISIGGEVGSALQASLNAECFYNNRNLDVRLVNLKYLMTQLTPFALVGINIAFWNIYYKLKKRTRGTQEFYNRIILTTVIIGYNILPQTIISCLNMFRCRNLYRTDSPIYFLTLDYDMECWTSEHLAWAIGVNLPFLFLWTMVIPLFIFVKLKRNKDNFEKQDFRQKYSFIYNGYKKEYYYWEFVLLLRKILSIMVVVFVSIRSLFLQTFLLTVISIIFAFVHYSSMPYEKKEINRVESYSLFSSICSSMLALYVYASVSFPDGFEGLFTIIGVISMAGFLAFWFKEYLKTYQKATGTLMQVLRKLKGENKTCWNFGSKKGSKIKVRTTKVRMGNFEKIMLDEKSLDESIGKIESVLVSRVEVEKYPFFGGMESILKDNEEKVEEKLQRDVEDKIIEIDGVKREENLSQKN